IIPATQAQGETKRRLVSYRVRKGDTLLVIADRFSVDSDDVKKWNRLKTNHVARGMVLRIYTQGSLPESASSRSHAAPKKKTRIVAQAASPAPDKN
ncbi:MAG: LysM peptidoglycan-binding domain-containing protein, partial [Acidobacteria bacterium]|nr:LysM peptidoglycan-binding domain-containing protein [Acidobacteriota bacterium]